MLLGVVTLGLLAGCAGSTDTDSAGGHGGPASEAALPIVSESTTAGPTEGTTLGEPQPPAEPRPAELSDGSTWTLTRLWEDGQPRSPVVSPAPSFTGDGGMDPVGDGGGRLIVRTGCGEIVAWLFIDQYVMSVDDELGTVDLDGCEAAASDDANILLSVLSTPLTIAIDDTTMTLSNRDGEPRLAFTAPRPAPLPTPPLITVPGDWRCERIEISTEDRDQVGGRDTASDNLEPFLPAALRTDELAITLDGREVGRIEVEESGPRRTVTVTAYEYCLPPTIDPSPAPAGDGPYGSWILTDDGGTDQPTDTTTTLELTQTQALGSTACNGYQADTAADVEGRFRVSRVLRTEVGCGEPFESAEQRFADALAQVDRWEVTNDGRLVLHGPALVLEFSPHG